jgi:hypothetical protein
VAAVAAAADSAFLHRVHGRNSAFSTLYGHRRRLVTPPTHRSFAAPRASKDSLSVPLYFSTPRADAALLRPLVRVTNERSRSPSRGRKVHNTLSGFAKSISYSTLVTPFFVSEMPPDFVCSKGKGDGKHGVQTRRPTRYWFVLYEITIKHTFYNPSHPLLLYARHVMR